jgi:hypothetical protein
LLKQKWEIAQSLDTTIIPGMNETEEALNQIFQLRLHVQDLRKIATNMARGSSLARPARAARRIVLIALFHENGAVVEKLLRDMANTHSPSSGL